MKKLFVIVLAAAVALTSVAYGAQDADMQVQETGAAADVTVSSPDTSADTLPEESPKSQNISGYYIINYSQSGTDIKPGAIYESDLLAAAMTAGTAIWHFHDDGTLEIFDADGFRTVPFALSDDSLTVTEEGKTRVYSYEFIDNLLILRGEEGSSALYSFPLEDLDHISMGDHSVIEIDEAAVKVTDEEVEAYIDNVLHSFITYDTITEGIVKSGDLITISFEGILEGEEEPFEGGSDDGITFLLGSGALIPGFEEQLEGREIGSSFDVSITFPEDYSGNADLIGKNAVFNTTLLNRIETSVPELTDEWVQDFSQQYLPGKLETVEQYRKYSREYLEEYVMDIAVLNTLMEQVSIDGYNQEVARMLLDYAAQVLEVNAASAGVDTETFAKNAGYESAQAYAQNMALSYMNVAMTVNKVLCEKGIFYTPEELDQALSVYLKQNGSSYSVEEYKTKTSPADLWVFTNLEFKYKLAIEALKDSVIIVPHEETSETQEPSFVPDDDQTSGKEEMPEQQSDD